MELNLNIFGKNQGEIGSLDKNLVLRTKGRVYIRYGRKYIELLDDKGNINVKIPKVLTKVDSEDKMTENGFYLLDGDLYVCVDGEVTLITGVDGQYIEYGDKQELTLELISTALLNIGLVFPDIKDAQKVITTGIVFIGDKIYYINDGKIKEIPLNDPIKGINNALLSSHPSKNYSAIIWADGGWKYDTIITRDEFEEYKLELSENEKEEKEENEEEEDDSIFDPILYSKVYTIKSATFSSDGVTDLITAPSFNLNEGDIAIFSINAIKAKKILNKEEGTAVIADVQIKQKIVEEDGEEYAEEILLYNEDILTFNLKVKDNQTLLYVDNLDIKEGHMFIEEEDLDDGVPWDTKIAYITIENDIWIINNDEFSNILKNKHLYIKAEECRKEKFKIDYAHAEIALEENYPNAPTIIPHTVLGDLDDKSKYYNSPAKSFRTYNEKKSSQGLFSDLAVFAGAEFRGKYPIESNFEVSDFPRYSKTLNRELCDNHPLGEVSNNDPFSLVIPTIEWINLNSGKLEEPLDSINKAGLGKPYGIRTAIVYIGDHWEYRDIVLKEDLDSIIDQIEDGSDISIKKQYTVSWKVGDNIIYTELVTEGEYAQYPSTPGYLEPQPPELGLEFSKWNFDYEQSKITEDTTITAIFKAAYLKRYYSGEGTFPDGSTLKELKCSKIKFDDPDYNIKEYPKNNDFDFDEWELVKLTDYYKEYESIYANDFLSINWYSSDGDSEHSPFKFGSDADKIAPNCTLNSDSTCLTLKIKKNKTILSINGIEEHVYALGNSFPYLDLGNLYWDSSEGNKIGENITIDSSFILRAHYAIIRIDLGKACIKNINAVLDSPLFYRYEMDNPNLPLNNEMILNYIEIYKRGKLSDNSIIYGGKILTQLEVEKSGYIADNYKIRKRYNDDSLEEIILDSQITETYSGIGGNEILEYVWIKNPTITLTTNGGTWENGTSEDIVVEGIPDDFRTIALQHLICDTKYFDEYSDRVITYDNIESEICLRSDKNNKNYVYKIIPPEGKLLKAILLLDLNGNILQEKLGYNMILDSFDDSGDYGYSVYINLDVSIVPVWSNKCSVTFDANGGLMKLFFGIVDNKPSDSSDKQTYFVTKIKTYFPSGHKIGLPKFLYDKEKDEYYRYYKLRHVDTHNGKRYNQWDGEEDLRTGEDYYNLHTTEDGKILWNYSELLNGSEWYYETNSNGDFINVTSEPVIMNKDCCFRIGWDTNYNNSNPLNISMYDPSPIYWKNASSAEYYDDSSASAIRYYSDNVYTNLLFHGSELYTDKYEFVRWKIEKWNSFGFVSTGYVISEKKENSHYLIEDFNGESVLASTEFRFTPILKEIAYLEYIKELIVRSGMPNIEGSWSIVSPEVENDGSIILLYNYPIGENVLLHTGDNLILPRSILNLENYTLYCWEWAYKIGYSFGIRRNFYPQTHVIGDFSEDGTRTSIKQSEYPIIEYSGRNRLSPIFIPYVLEHNVPEIISASGGEYTFKYRLRYYDKDTESFSYINHLYESDGKRGLRMRENWTVMNKTDLDYMTRRSNTNDIIQFSDSSDVIDGVLGTEGVSHKREVKEDEYIYETFHIQPNNTGKDRYMWIEFYWEKFNYPYDKDSEGVIYNKFNSYTSKEFKIVQPSL